MESTAPALSGLEQLRALLTSGRLAPISETLQFKMTEIDEGRAVFRAVPGAHAYNPIGSIHGGYTAAILDSACGCAVHSLLSATQSYTTLELKVSYHRALTKDSGEIKAVGSVLSRGRTRRVFRGEAVRQPRASVRLGDLDAAAVRQESLTPPRHPFSEHLPSALFSAAAAEIPVHCRCRFPRLR